MLRPIKSKELLVSTAMELNLPVSVVTTIAQEYWREVRESLSDLKQDRVHVTNLGDFTIKHWKLDNTIDMLQKTKIKYPEQQHLDEYIKKMEMLKEMMSEEQQRKEFIKTHKRFIHETKLNKKDMELPIPDLGRHKK